MHLRIGQDNARTGHHQNDPDLLGAGLGSRVCLGLWNAAFYTLHIPVALIIAAIDRIKQDLDPLWVKGKRMMS